MELVIGDKAWSSWSMRPWLVLRRARATFTERLVRLRRDDTRDGLTAAGSPSGKVPVLKTDEGLVIWDSLAICEWAAERFPAARLWPEDSDLRALARSTAAEMHAGFPALRSEFPMDLAARTPKPPSRAAAAELRRLVSLWTDGRGRSAPHGPFLYGGWSVADAFFTPVATRLRSYAVDLADFGDDGVAAGYAALLLAQPEYLEWEAGAWAEVTSARGP